MTYVYALFYCFTNVDVPCVLIGQLFDDPAACLESKSKYEHSGGMTPELLTESGIKYVCMKQPVPTATGTLKIASPRILGLASAHPQS